MEYYAHIRQLENGKVQRQTVAAHLQSTAKRAGECLRGCGLEHAAYLAGLLHDLGKYTEAFQNYLLKGEGTKGSVIHTFQGCRLFMERYHDRADANCRLAAELLAFAVGAHHGLFDCVDENRKIGLKYRTEKDNLQYDRALHAFLQENMDLPTLDRNFHMAAEEIGTVAVAIDRAYQSDDEYCFALGLLARLLLSAVIEGDRNDTAAFFHGTVPQTVIQDMAPVWADRLRYLEGKLETFPTDSPVARARRSISDQCKDFAAEKPGIYRLYVPTGGGKTLASLRYALAHGEIYHRRRIIFTSPLLSILEQNAKVIREFVGDDRLILEHHSNLVQEGLSDTELDQRELLIQSWDAPIIITTMVQLLNTLFDGKTSSVRRFEALCDSILVIDEVQTVPTKLLTLFNLAMRFLSEQCGATIVLCSATQPCLEHADHPLREKPKDMVPWNPELWQAFERTTICPLENTRLENFPVLIRGIMEETDSLLVICNKKDQAAWLLRETRSSDYQSYHLSAAMCMQHRRNTVQAIQNALKQGKRILCISTQVMEAGVDISFGRVLRLTAGMDSVVQAAGRCNRSGEQGMVCPVYLASCTDENLGMLQDIQRGKTATIALLEAYREDSSRFDDSLSSDAAIEAYYRNFYREMSQGAQDGPVPERKTSLFDLLSRNTGYADEHCDDVENYMLWQAFRTAGQYFSVFDQDTVDVLVPYGMGKKLIAELCTQRCAVDLERRERLIRVAGDYTVSVYPYQKKKLEENHGLTAICGDCILALAEEFYDDTLGVTTGPGQQGFLEV